MATTETAPSDAGDTRTAPSPDAPLRGLLRAFATHPVTPRLSWASRHDDSLVAAVPDAMRPFWLSSLPEQLTRPVVAVLPSSADVERTALDIARFTEPPLVLDAWETLPYEHVSPSIETMGRRLTAARSLASERPPPLTLLPVRALLQRVLPDFADAPVVRLEAGAECDLEGTIEQLVDMGYERAYMVEARGELAVRGGILDVYPSTEVQPVRVELWGDEIDTIRRFSVTDQRSVESLEAIEIAPCREVRPSEELRERARVLAGEVPGGREAFERFADGQVFAGMESWLPWLLDGRFGDDPFRTTIMAHIPDDALVLVCDPKRCLDRATDLRREEEDLARALAGTWYLPHAGVLEAIADTDEEAPGPLGAEVPVGESAPGSGPEDVGADVPVGGPAPNGATAVGGPAPMGEVPEPPRLFADAGEILAATTHPVWQVPATPDSPETFHYSAGALEPLLGRPDDLATRLKELLAAGTRVVVAADGAGSRTRIRDLLQAEGLSLRSVEGAVAPDGDRGVITVAPLSRGFVSSELGLALLAEPDLTGRRRSHRPARPTRSRSGASNAVYGDLREGDHVVHYHHGVGRFVGMVERGLGGVTREYLCIEYARSDKLYVPVDQLDAVRKYVGGDTPKLSRMGGADWARTKGKVRRAVAEIADELVELYRQRLLARGHAYPPDSDLMLQMRESFPFEETPDQRQAIERVSEDMQSTVPMDRLVCGDVGFGKTEIALRAAMKAVADGRQVAVLVPTTVLAQQHFHTFSDRFADFPIRVEMLSRFLTPAEQRGVVRDAASGKVDVVVGTHRILSQDLALPNLGLLVVDEEQRFGVKAKEKLKELRANVDVLTLTATPIPRTLEFALTGIRDMSLVATPPQDRQPVLTYVGEFDEQAVSAAVRRELLRDGQVFYVHNRVQSIDRAAAALARLVPEARIGVAHGQMDEGSLEQVMLRFLDGEYDVLVSTTIIESGLDIPRANTLIVERADLLGLAQMYQLRGRVGRSERRAYSYFFHPRDRQLTEEAHERLKVVAEHQDLGSGFAIAMRDLELRGAGNLLGASQSGHIAAVGFDLYCQLVNEAVASLKGEEVHEPEQVRIDLPAAAYLPDDYVPRESLRLEAYRRLADAASDEGIADVRDEWQDRYGALPEPAELLLELAEVKLAALAAGASDVVFARDRLTVKGVVPTGSKRMRLERLHKGTVIKEELETVVVPYKNPAASGRGAGARVELSGRHVAEWTATLLQELT